MCVTADHITDLFILAIGKYRMDGYYTTFNECATGVTAQHTIFEQRQSDNRATVDTCNRQDGASWL